MAAVWRRLFEERGGADEAKLLLYVWGQGLRKKLPDEQVAIMWEPRPVSDFDSMNGVSSALRCVVEPLTTKRSHSIAPAHIPSLSALCSMRLLPLLVVPRANVPGHRQGVQTAADDSSPFATLTRPVCAHMPVVVSSVYSRVLSTRLQGCYYS